MSRGHAAGGDTVYDSMHPVPSNTSPVWILLLRGPRLIWDSGLTCSVLASLIFSFSALFVKLTAGRVPVLEVCLIRSSISVGLSFILMQLAGLPYKLFFGHRKNLRLLFLRGCCGACSMTAYYMALFMLPLGDAVTINLIGPPVTAVFARLLLKEPLGYRGMVGCLISLAGVVLVARPPFLFGGHEVEWAGSHSLGTLCGVVSAVLGGGSSMTIRLIGGSEPAAVVALWFHTATMLLSVFPLLAGIPNRPVLLSHVDGGYMLGVAGTSFIAQLLSTRGLQRCQAAKAAAMGFTQVVYSNIMGSVFFNDKPTLVSFLGALLILAGVLLVTLRLSKGSPEAAQGPASCLASAASSHSAITAKDTGADDTQALLLEGQLLSHTTAAAPAGPENVDEHAAGAAVAVVSLQTRSDSSLKQAAATLTHERTRSPLAGEDMAMEAGGQEPLPDGLLAQIAASAAVALSGELCPAGSTAVAQELSRQVSRQLAASRAASQMSRQPSQWLPGSPSAFFAGPAVANSGSAQQPQQEQEQLTQQMPHGPGQSERWGGEVEPSGLRQALMLESESLPGSPDNNAQQLQQQPEGVQASK